MLVCTVGPALRHYTGRVFRLTFAAPSDSYPSLRSVPVIILRENPIRPGVDFLAFPARVLNFFQLVPGWKPSAPRTAAMAPQTDGMFRGNSGLGYQVPYLCNNWMDSQKRMDP